MRRFPGKALIAAACIAAACIAAHAAGGRDSMTIELDDRALLITGDAAAIQQIRLLVEQPGLKESTDARDLAAELAEKYNSYLAIENHGHALLNTVDSLKAFTDLNKSKRIGIALAPYHIQGLKESVPEAIKICGKQLFFFYAWQKQAGLKQLPGVGTTDFVPWIEALAEIKYKGFVNPFAHMHPGTDIMTANLAKSKDYLLQCYKKINGKG